MHRSRNALRLVLSVALALAMVASAAPASTAQEEDMDEMSPESKALANLSWRAIGPANMGGRVTDVLGVPGDPKTFWVGGADGGLWKTTNGGTTFEGQWQGRRVLLGGRGGAGAFRPQRSLSGFWRGRPP